MKFITLLIIFTNFCFALDNPNSTPKQILVFSAEKDLFHSLGFSSFENDFEDLEGGNCALLPILKSSDYFTFHFSSSDSVTLIYIQHPERPTCLKAHQIYNSYSRCKEDTINFFKGSPFCHEQTNTEKDQIINFDQSNNLILSEKDPNKPYSRKIRVLYYKIINLNI